MEAANLDGISVMMTANNRPEYFKETIDSWKKVRGHWAGKDGWAPLVYCEPGPVELEMQRIAWPERDWLGYSVNPERYGVLINPWTCFNDMFNLGASFVVLAEDDIVVSSDIMEYFKWASVEFAEDEDVLGVCAFTQECGPENEVRKVQSFSPLIWGTWRDRWETILRDRWDKDYSTGPGNGVEAGWDWEINRILKEKDMNFIFPRASRSNHIGQYNGTHMTPDLYHTSRSASFVSDREPLEYVLMY